MGRPWLSFALKAAVSAALIWFLFGGVDWAQVGTRLRQLDIGDALLCLAILGAQIMATSQRWRIIARVIGVVFDLCAAMRMMWIGLFFNQALPSSIGGDAVRAFLVTREGASVGRAVAVVLCDRVFALLVLVAVMALTLPLMFGRVGDPSARWGMTILAAAGLAGFAVFLTLGERVALILRRWKVSRPIGNLAADFHALFSRPGRAAGLFALSAVIHLGTVIAVFALADGLGLSVGLIDCLVLIPPILLATMLPLSIAGWGVREGASAVASVMSFHFRDEVLPYYGGGRPAARVLGAYDFMYWEVMRRAAERGARLFDFGRSKAGTGSFAFKKNWGFEPRFLAYEYHLAAGEGVPEVNPLNPKYRLFIAGWKRLPLPLANRIGPFLARGLG